MDNGDFEAELRLHTGLSSPRAGPLSLNCILLPYLNSSPFLQMGNESPICLPQPHLYISRRSAEALSWSPGLLHQSTNPLTSSISLPITPCPGRTAITLTVGAEPGSVQHPCYITGSPRTNGFLPGASVILSEQGRIHTPRQHQVCGKDTCFYLANPKDLPEN